MLPKGGVIGRLVTGPRRMTSSSWKVPAVQQHAPLCCVFCELCDLVLDNIRHLIARDRLASITHIGCRMLLKA